MNGREVGRVEVFLVLFSFLRFFLDGGEEFIGGVVVYRLKFGFFFVFLNII